jgi:antitoxin HigA-1
LKCCAAKAKANTASVLTINGGFVLNDPTEHQARQTWRLSITIKKFTMPITAVHPGEQLAEELKALDMSASELVRKIDVPTNRVTQILNGTRGVGDTASRLAHFFGTSAQFWLNLQALYDLRLAQERTGKSIKELRALKRSDSVDA